MKSAALFAVALVVSLPMASCSSLDPKTHVLTPADFGAEAQQLWARPVEYTWQTLGDVTGQAYEVSFLGWTIEGDRSVSEFKILSAGSKLSALENIAADKAVTSMKGADGLYVTYRSESFRGLPLLYTRRDVVVRGKALQLVELGPISALRADIDRFRVDDPSLVHHLWEQLKGAAP